MVIQRLYTNVTYSVSFLRVQSDPSLPKTARRLDNGTSVTFTGNGVSTRAALFGESDLNKTVYLSVS